MGYTHYFSQTRSFTDDEWNAVLHDTNVILEYCERNDIVIQLQDDNSEPAIVDHKEICFNGADEDGHETFYITKEAAADAFAYCKTARKPYDLAVGLVLLSCERHAQGVLDISSDGWWDEWSDIRNVFEELFEVVVTKPARIERRKQ